MVSERKEEKTIAESYYDDYTPEMTRNYGDDVSPGVNYNRQDAHPPQQEQQQYQQPQQHGYSQNYSEDAPGWN